MKSKKGKQMAIRLHSFITTGKRYIQVESQPHHITGIFRKIVCSCTNMYGNQGIDAKSASFECEEDGTITFYQSVSTDGASSGIWTYLVYECPEGEEKVYQDSSIDSSTNALKELFAGQRLVQVAVDIHEYLQYKSYETEYLDVHLPDDWNSLEGRKIANLLLDEFKAFKSSSLFAEDVGKQYAKVVLEEFIQVGRQVLEKGGTFKDFELAQYDVLQKIRIDDIANLIIEYNDYRLWQALLPSKSKAVEYAFNAALNLICRMK